MAYTGEEQAAHRKQWIEALRSGKYKQAQGRLRNSEGMCCLGIACDISGLGEWSKGIDGDFFTFVDESGSFKSALSIKVMEWLGLYSYNGKLKGSSATLAARNDKGATFKEIADLIEDNRVEVVP